MSLRLVAIQGRRKAFLSMLAIAVSGPISNAADPPNRSLLILTDDLEEVSTTPKLEASPSSGPSKLTSPVASHGLFRLSNNKVLAKETIQEDTETIRERFPNGNLRVERQVALDAEGNYVNHGPYQEWNEKGQLIISGEFHLGVRAGIWMQYIFQINGTVLAASPYTEFEAPFLSEAEFSGDLLQGTWRISDAKGRVASFIEFQNGLRHGKAEWFFVNGNPYFRSEYKDGLLSGEAIEFQRDGNIKRQDEYLEGRRAEVKREFYRERVPKLEMAVLTPPHVLKSADDWQTTKMAAYESRGEGTRHGPFIVWHENGQVRARGFYDMNRLHEDYESWYESGDRESAGRFEDGRMVGTWTWWHRNGMKRAHGNYIDGNPEGNWRAWSVDGKLVRQETFDAKQFQITTPDTLQKPLVANAGMDLVR